MNMSNVCGASGARLRLGHFCGFPIKRLHAKLKKLLKELSTEMFLFYIQCCNTLNALEV